MAFDSLVVAKMSAAPSAATAPDDKPIFTVDSGKRRFHVNMARLRLHAAETRHQPHAALILKASTLIRYPENTAILKVSPASPF